MEDESSTETGHSIHLPALVGSAFAFILNLDHGGRSPTDIEDLHPFRPSDPVVSFCVRFAAYFAMGDGALPRHDLLLELQINDPRGHGEGNAYATDDAEVGGRDLDDQCGRILVEQTVGYQRVSLRWIENIFLEIPERSAAAQDDVIVFIVAIVHRAERVGGHPTTLLIADVAQSQRLIDPLLLGKRHRRSYAAAGTCRNLFGDARTEGTDHHQLVRLRGGR